MLHFLLLLSMTSAAQAAVPYADYEGPEWQAFDRGECERVLPLATAAAAAKKPKSTRLMGLMNFYGCGVPENLPRAFELLKTALADGDSGAALHLAFFYDPQSDETVPAAKKDYPTALRYFRAAIDGQNSSAKLKTIARVEMARFFFVNHRQPFRPEEEQTYRDMAASLRTAAAAGNPVAKDILDKIGPSFARIDAYYAGLAEKRFGLHCTGATSDGKPLDDRYDLDLNSKKFQNKGTGKIFDIAAVDEASILLSDVSETGSGWYLQHRLQLNRVTGKLSVIARSGGKKLVGTPTNLTGEATCEKIPYAGMQMERKF